MKLSEVTGGAPKRLKLSQVSAPTPSAPRDADGKLIQHGFEFNPDWVTDEMSQGERFITGADAGITKLGHGAKQLGLDALAAMGVDVGDAQEEARLKAEEYKKYGADETFAGAAGNVVGNMVATAPLMAVGGGGAAAAGGTAKALATLRALGYGAAEGAGTAALAPVSREGERAENMMYGGAFGAALPAAGAALRSAPFRRTAEMAADWNPFSYTGRLAKRNEALSKADDIANARTDWTNELSTARHNAGIENVNRDYATDVARAELDAADATAANLTTAQQRAQTANALREAHLDSAREELAKRAGWTKVPKDNIELEAELNAVGERYGKTLEPYVVPVSSFSKDVAGLAETAGLDPADARVFTKLSDQLTALQEANGGIPGTMYRTIRAELNAAKGRATGTAKEQLDLAVQTLDKRLERAVGDTDKYNEIVKMRNQYSLGSRVKEVDIEPGQKLDVNKVRKKLKKNPTDPLGARQYLVDTLASAPQTQRIPTRVPRAEPNYPPEPVHPMAPELLPKVTTRKEEKDILKLAIVNGLIGFGTGGAHLGAAPAMYAMKGAANNRAVSDLTSRLLRGYTQMELSD